MIAFITSVRHPNNSTNYKKVEYLLERTLKSVCGQKDQDYCVIVVCNKVPTSFSSSEKVHFVQVDFPPPSLLQEARIEIPAILKDKSTKYVVGLIKAKEYNPDYVMFFDADDLIHCGISEYANANVHGNGWFINNGFVYRDGGLLISEVANFHQLCGTSNILKFDLICPPKELTLAVSQEKILDAIDNDFLYKILAGHRSTVSWFKERGAELKPYPFVAAIWVTNTGENHSGVNFFGRPRFISSDIIRNFNFEIPSAPLTFLVTVLFYYPYGFLRALLRRLKRTIGH